MVALKPLKIIVPSILGAITFLNLGLIVNFAVARDQALAGAFSGESIYLLAGIELAVVLLAYILHKQQTHPTHSQASSPVNPP